MAKASQISGTAQESTGDESYSLWQVWGKELIILEVITTKTGTYEGKETFSVLTLCKNVSEEEPVDIKVWVNGRQADTINNFFLQHPKGSISEDVMEGTFWLNPTVSGVKYYGWTLLDHGVNPEDFAIPQKAAQALYKDQMPFNKDTNGKAV